MAILKFEGFVFDTSSHQLRHKGKLLALRPKALKLLVLLISNRTRVVSKREIFTNLWGSEFARDHLLFQLISELRKTPFKADFIRTQPNLGYQWNVHTTEVQFPVFKSTKVAASVVVCMLALSALYIVSSKTRVITGLANTQLPAHTAFSKGVFYMHSGEHLSAEKWLKFALIENPGSIETSIFLAEALFLQDKFNESLGVLLTLSKNERLSGYNEMAVSDLLSRVYQRQGRLYDAIQYAHDSRPDSSVAQCSAEAINDRVASLEGGAFKSSPHAHLLRPKNHVGGMSTSDDVSKQLEGYDQDCSQLERKPVDGFGCVPEFDYDLYVSLDKIKYYYS